MPKTTLSADELKQLMIESLNLEGMTPEMIENDAPLMDSSLGLDSVDALELVVALEKKLGVSIRSEEVNPETFSSVNSILGFIEAKTAT